MSFVERVRAEFRGLRFVVVMMCALLLLVVSAPAQETTGGMDGTITDPSGAVVPGAHIVLTGTTMVGSKEADTDASGFYHFTNLPPGTYTLRVTAKGFETLERGNLTVLVGQLPIVNAQLQLGSSTSTVEVTSAAPVIDVSTTHNLTNLSEDTLKDVPHGYSFQSVLQYAPSVRNEPLAGGMIGPNAAGGSGTGGQSAGSGTNGQAFGFSDSGGADSENSYLVEGQETADAVGGFSHTNVPFAFIQDVEIKSSGIEAEYGGAMGGVMNVVMQKGGSDYHGSIFSQFERSSWDGSPNAYPRYDPSYTTPSPIPAFLPDATPQYYQPKKDNVSNNFPGFIFGGPLLPSLKNKVWFVVGFNPEFDDVGRTVNWEFPTPTPPYPATVGPTPFNANTQTYYSYARVDAAVTQKIRVFGSWLYQYQRQEGEFLPQPDSVNGLTNGTATSPEAVYGHNLGYAAPNVTTNVGADITLSPRVVATFRWGYNFQNYHDFGMPTGGAFDAFATGCSPTCTDNLGGAISGTQLNQLQGYFSAPNNVNNTTFDATHHNQINADVAWYQGGWFGEHNFKFGYALNRLSNSVEQHFNEPNVTVFAGANNYYSPIDGNVGGVNCAVADPGGTYNAATGKFTGGIYHGCAGQYGYLYIQDYGSYGQATSMDHALFAQDSWTPAPGLTINAGVRFEHEYLPAEQQPQGGISKPIQFGWGGKVGPRIGVAWDPFKNGKWKIFGSYGKYYDVMKLNLAISSFGGQYWQNCYYALNTTDLSSIVPVFNNAGRYCVGPDSASEANFGSSGTPAGITFLENQNFRTFPTSCATCTATEEGVAPGLKPYQLHETVFGIDHQLSNNLFFEARWNRRRLDDAIEDSAIFDANTGGETFVIVNPGKGINKTFDGFYNFLYGTGSGCAGASCPPNNIPAARSYDGVEFRLTKPMSQHWSGMFSYTYSHFRGNYEGLTSTDITDGGGGRNAPNNSRAFDEPFFSYDDTGGSSSGPLATDRPNTFKGYGYYELPWLQKFATDFGLFQYFYQGSPVSSYADVGYSFAPTFGAYSVPNAETGAFPTYIVGRGNFLPLTTNADGTVNVGTPYARRTPWYMQTDFQVSQSYKIGEGVKALSFGVTFTNLFNQHAVVAYWSAIGTNYYSQWLTPGGYSIGPYQFYKAAESPYNVASLINNAAGSTLGGSGAMTINSLYGKPLYYQSSRSIYMTAKFTF
jgi:Carboxypeptidase regulatory-like domain